MCSKEDGMTRFIFVPTIQHTGTWFVIKFLTDHPEVSGFIQVRNLHQVPKDGREVSRHGVGGSLGMGIVIEKLFHDELNVLHTHHVHAKPGSEPLVNPVAGCEFALALICPTVVPLRDPLVSLINWGERGPRLGRPLSEHVRAWVTFVDGLISVSKVLAPAYIPVDILNDFDSRLVALTKALDVAGIPDASHAAEWAKVWPKVNSASDFELKSRYYQGDAGFIKAAIPDGWKSLRDAEATLRPFLEERGYKNLMWWN